MVANLRDDRDGLREMLRKANERAERLSSELLDIKAQRLDEILGGLVQVGSVVAKAPTMSAAEATVLADAVAKFLADASKGGIVRAGTGAAAGGVIGNAAYDIAKWSIRTGWEQFADVVQTINDILMRAAEIIEHSGGVFPWQ